LIHQEYPALDWRSGLSARGIQLVNFGTGLVNHGGTETQRKTGPSCFVLDYRNRFPLCPCISVVESLL
jgi:hypothetical protein